MLSEGMPIFAPAFSVELPMLATLRVALTFGHQVLFAADMIAFFYRGFHTLLCICFDFAFFMKTVLTVYNL